jgi:hypothetical protein
VAAVVPWPLTGADDEEEDLSSSPPLAPPPPEEKEEDLPSVAAVFSPHEEVITEPEIDTREVMGILKSSKSGTNSNYVLRTVLPFFLGFFP